MTRSLRPPIVAMLGALLLTPPIGSAAETVPPPGRVAPDGPDFTSKLFLTQATGCQNDGSVEFCVRKTDLALQAMVRRIAPSVKTGRSRGRVGCDPEKEILFFFPTPGDDPTVCSGRHGALTDRAWRQLTELAALDGIGRIAPTRYE